LKNQRIDPQNIIDRLTSIEPRTTCCERCHIGFEEKYLLPHLSKKYQKRLKSEHLWLIENDFPKEEMYLHIAFEEEIFLNCLKIPDILLERMVADHIKWELDFD